MILSVRLRLLFMSLALLMVGCDHATKQWAHTTLRAARSIELLPGTLDLRYAVNPGVAFSALRDLPEVVRFPLIVVMGVFAITMLVTWWIRRKPLRWTEHAAYALILGGALGNLIDRLMRGHVIDFIHLHHWPIFNIADVCIVAGMLLMAFTWLRYGRPRSLV